MLEKNEFKKKKDKLCMEIKQTKNLTDLRLYAKDLHVLVDMGVSDCIIDRSEKASILYVLYEREDAIRREQKEYEKMLVDSLLLTNTRKKKQKCI